MLFERTATGFRPFAELPDVLDTFRVLDGDRVVGSRGTSLHLHDGRSWSRSSLPHRPVALHANRLDDVVAVCDYGGIWTFDGERAIAVKDRSAPGEWASSGRRWGAVAGWRDGELWVGGTNGSHSCLGMRRLGAWSFDQVGCGSYGIDRLSVLPSGQMVAIGGGAWSLNRAGPAWEPIGRGSLVIDVAEVEGQLTTLELELHLHPAVRLRCGGLGAVFAVDGPLLRGPTMTRLASAGRVVMIHEKRLLETVLLPLPEPRAPGERDPQR